MTVMTPFVFVVRVRGKRDMVLARQRTRQLAGLLGFEAGDQACLAAAAFALACEARPGNGAVLCFRVEQAMLHIGLKESGRQHLCIEKVLPHEPRLSAQDIKWALRELARRTPLNLFDEMKGLNQELLAALLSRRTEKVPAPQGAAA
jgi:hypothetical protein